VKPNRPGRKWICHRIPFPEVRAKTQQIRARLWARTPQAEAPRHACRIPLLALQSRQFFDPIQGSVSS